MVFVDPCFIWAPLKKPFPSPTSHKNRFCMVPVLQVGDPVFMGFCETCKVTSWMMGATTTAGCSCCMCVPIPRKITIQEFRLKAILSFKSTTLGTKKWWFKMVLFNFKYLKWTTFQRCSSNCHKTRKKLSKSTNGISLEWHLAGFLLWVFLVHVVSLNSYLKFMLHKKASGQQQRQRLLVFFDMTFLHISSTQLN